jgi:hypothetical protein
VAATAWKRLVLDLTDEGFESPYLDRLRARLNVEQSHRELEKEILQEMAAALGRAEDKLNLALLRLQLIARELESLPPRGAGVDLRERVEGYNAQREVASRCLWELTIHREALGFRRNEILERLYPIPPRRRLPAG